MEALIFNEYHEYARSQLHFTRETLNPKKIRINFGAEVLK